MNILVSFSMLCQWNLQNDISLGMKLNFCIAHGTTYTIVFCCDVLKNGF